MISTKLASSIGLIVLAAGIGLSQSTALPPPPSVSPTPVPRISEQLAKALESRSADVPTPRELREQAYAKLLEGQRYVFWSGERSRSRAGRQNNVRLAREAFHKSVELDPMLSEGYTALAELAINMQPQDSEEAIQLATLATRVNPNSFGSRRLLARLYSFKSKLVSGPFDSASAQKAIAEWRQVARLDPRNAEAWALLSDLYEKTGDTTRSIDALRNWISSSPPLDTRFYQMLTGGRNLSPETATVRLGTMLLKAGRTREAIDTLSLLVADEPDNTTAVDVLREAVENADKETAATAVEALRQAVFANPTNVSLITLLAETQSRSGMIDAAATLLRDASARLVSSDRASASVLQVTLGDLMARADRPRDAVAAYEASFIARGLEPSDTLADDEREFAMHLFEKMIATYKNAGSFDEAKTVVERSRRFLGKDDMFADRQLIQLLRESGSRAEALAAVRVLRQRIPNDYGSLRLEATLLTETGKVDEAVALVKKLMETPAAPPVQNPTGAGGSESITVAVPQFDAFSNYLFISNLYSQANRGKEAVDAANQAFDVARGAERKQIARLTLATAQQMSNDFKGAEATLRGLLKETPGNPIALNNLGYFLLERNESIDEAFTLIQQAVKIDPTNPSYLDSLGWAYFKLGKLPEAEKTLKDALRSDSSSGTIHEHLGDVYEKQGKTDLAKSSWNRAASLFSDPADVKRVKIKVSAGR